jgi:hypothetical protein
MRHIYTLRRLFGDSVRGKANLDAAIRNGSLLARWVATPAAFWVKINNDWIFNLSGLLAYTFLFAVFPLLILVLAITGFILRNIAPGTETLVTDNIVRAARRDRFGDCGGRQRAAQGERWLAAGRGSRHRSLRWLAPLHHAGELLWRRLPSAQS